MRSQAPSSSLIPFYSSGQRRRTPPPHWAPVMAMNREWEKSSTVMWRSASARNWAKCNILRRRVTVVTTYRVTQEVAQIHCTGARLLLHWWVYVSDLPCHTVHGRRKVFLNVDCCCKSVPLITREPNMCRARKRRHWLVTLFRNRQKMKTSLSRNLVSFLFRPYLADLYCFCLCLLD